MSSQRSTTDLEALARRIDDGAPAFGARRSALVAVAAPSTGPATSPAEGSAELVDRVASVLRPGDVVVELGSGAVLWCERLVADDDALLIATRVDEQVRRLGAEVWLCEPSTSPAELAGGLSALDAGTARPRPAEAGRWMLVDDDVRRRAAARRRLESELRSASERGAFELHYQPVVALTTGSTTGFEALLRWQHDGTWVQPSSFIPIAEEAGLIETIGEWVLRTALTQLSRWHDAAADPTLQVGINVSARQLSRPGFPDLVDELLRTCGVQAPVPADRVWLELTESVLVDDDASRAHLAELADMGLRLVLDDFGTGYSSLTYLRQLPVHTLKLDRSFVTGVATDPQDAAIVGAVVGLADALGLSVVAEGVEHPEQADALRSMGCGSAQGSLFSEPLPAARAVELLT